MKNVYIYGFVRYHYVRYKSPDYQYWIFLFNFCGYKYILSSYLEKKLLDTTPSVQYR